MRECSDEEQEECWCITCAPKLYQWDAKFGSGVDPVSSVRVSPKAAKEVGGR